METTTTTIKSTDIEAAYKDERWLGWGYLGERRRFIEDNGPDAAKRADAAVIAGAMARGWGYDRLFDFLNSKPGRWFGDMAFGSDCDVYAAADKCMSYPL